MTTGWQEAYERDSRLIQHHPLFPRLVREVAIAEQPAHPGKSWRARNSVTFGMWMTRGMPRVDVGPNRRRAVGLARKVAADLNIFPTLPASEQEARVYGEAAQFARARLAGAPPGGGDATGAIR